MKKNLLQLLYFCFLLAVFSFSEAYSQGYPAIRNYSKITSDHSIGWSLIQDNRGVMYLGMQTGIIEFSNIHKSWFIKIPNSSTARSMAIDSNGIVYVGAQKEIGYLKPDANGLMQYESLLPKLKKQDQNFTEVSKVHNTKDGICFQTFEGLYFYKSGKFKIVKPSSSFHFSFYINDVFYVLERGIGLETYSNGNLQLVPGGSSFANDRIYSILPYNEKQLLITTRERGLFLYTLGNTSGNIIEPFAPEASNFLSENQVYDALTVNNQFVFATQRGGILIMDATAESIKVFDNSNLLKENKVNALYLDKNKDLWIAQDNYIARIELNSPFLILNENSGLYGNIAAVTKFEDKIYVATTYGLFVLEKDYGDKFSNARFKQYDLKTECFSFLKAKFKKVETLFVVSHLGIYEIRGSRLVPILMDYCFFAYQSKSNENKIYIGLKNGIVLLTKNGEIWNAEYPANNIDDEIKSIAEDKFGNLWLAGFKDGIYKINSANKESISNLDRNEFFEHFDTLNGLPTNDINKVFSYEDDVLFGTLNGFYKFDTKTKKFNKDESFSNALSTREAPQIYDFFEEKKNNYIAIIHDQVLGNELLKLHKANGKFENLFENTFKRLHEGDLISSYADGSDELLIGSSLGVLNLDLKNKSAYATSFNVLIKSVTIGQDSILFSGTFYEKKWVGSDTLFCPIENQSKNFIPQINYQLNSISFKFDCAFYEVAAFNNFTCYLEGYETDWRPWSTDGKINYSNLHEGKYRLHLKAKNIYDNESDEKVYEFIILAPWYRTIAAYLAYTILFFGFVYLLVQLSVRRLKTAKVLLENTVKERTSEIVKQNVEIQKQKNLVEIKNKDITDSINYAKRIQETILPPDSEINQLLPNSFILFLPKDILSGDFYWMDEIDSKVLVAAVDCTGHGVPGALMSIVGNNILNQSINEHRISKPSAILDELNKGVTNTLRQKNEESKVKDGMDIVLLAIDFKNRKLEFSGANNPLYLIRNGALTEIKGNKFPIGIFIGEEQKHFTNHEFDLQPGDTLYLFTDGYADQFGGPFGKKFKYNKFKETLLQIQPLAIDQQRETLFKTIKAWQGDAEQVDDILVIGIKIG